MVRYRPEFYDPPLLEEVWILGTPPPYRKGSGFYDPPSAHNSHLLVASLLVVIDESPLDVNWAGDLSGLEVGKLGKIAPKARKFLNIMLVFSMFSAIYNILHG